ncbi:hypothetical protein BGX21_002741 [Mortierella sp. AD011]|nr:hypothetical protein BGX20_004731 [Mortierella sp. AD010]KAF9379052.1 hypothetical protein BGX21_002741 [Mortierella sp. AD011]
MKQAAPPTIPKSIKRFISIDYYDKLDAAGKEIYLKGVKDAVEKLDEMAENILVDKYTSLNLAPFAMDITFVGMQFRGRHVFRESDVVTLERDFLNEYDEYAVKVLVEKGGQKVHVAYVTKDDAKALRRYRDFEKAPLQFLKVFPQSARYRITI